MLHGPLLFLPLTHSLSGPTAESCFHTNVAFSPSRVVLSLVGKLPPVLIQDHLYVPQLVTFMNVTWFGPAVHQHLPA